VLLSAVLLKHGTGYFKRDINTTFWISQIGFSKNDFIKGVASFIPHAKFDLELPSSRALYSELKKTAQSRFSLLSGSILNRALFVFMASCN